MSAARAEPRQATIEAVTATTRARHLATSGEVPRQRRDASALVDGIAHGTGGELEVTPGRGEREYGHLEPLLAEYAATEPSDPSRVGLRERLVVGYLPVARNIARRYRRRDENVEDLEQVATIGLLKALDRFRPEFERPFLAFAIPTMTGEVLRHFRDRAWPMRVPRRLKDLHVAISHTVVELSQQLNRAPRPSDIATALGITIEEVLEGLQASQAYRPDSLDTFLIPGEGGATRADATGAMEPGIERFVESHAIAPHLAALPRRERTILMLRFYDDLTQSQIAAKLGLSQMHISRILAKTLAQLRYAIDHDQPPTPSIPMTRATGPTASR